MRKIISCILVLCILLCAMPNLACAEDNAIMVELNGEILSFDVQPMIYNGRTMVPMRKIFESLCAEVAWDGETRTVTATTGDTVVVMKIDNTVMTVNGEEITLDVAPMIVNDRTLVPVRAASEGLGALVKWDDKTKTVIITKEHNEELFDDFEKRIKNSKLTRMGDSYYNWSIDIPEGIPLTILADDGTYFEFSTSGMTNVVSLNVADAGDTTIEDLKKYEQDYVQNSNSTLLSQTVEKTESGVEYVRTVYEYAHYYAYFRGDSRMFLKDGYVYSLYVRCFADDAEEVEYYKNIADSFEFTYDAAATEPLQKVEDGCRWYSDAKYKVGFDVPAGWKVINLGGNQVVFMSDTNASAESIGVVGLTIYSVTEGQSLEEYAQISKKAYAGLYESGDSAYKQSELAKITVDGKVGVYYTDEVKDEGFNWYHEDVFFYVGDYAYNIAFTLKNADRSVIDTVLRSFVARELDKNEIGHIEALLPG